jgi:hypothetical protein
MERWLTNALIVTLLVLPGASDVQAGKRTCTGRGKDRVCCDRFAGEVACGRSCCNTLLGGLRKHVRRYRERLAQLRRLRARLRRGIVLRRWRVSLPELGDRLRGRLRRHRQRSTELRVVRLQLPGGPMVRRRRVQLSDRTIELRRRLRRYADRSEQLWRVRARLSDRELPRRSLPALPDGLVPVREPERQPRGDVLPSRHGLQLRQAGQCGRVLRTGHDRLQRPVLSDGVLRAARCVLQLSVARGRSSVRDGRLPSACGVEGGREARCFGILREQVGNEFIASEQ